MKPYIPAAGDIVWTDFDPTRGREQAGRRPALVLSPAAFFRASRFAIVCPITARIRRFGTSVALPPDLAIQGEVLSSHVRSIDTQARPVAFSGTKVPPAILEETRAKVAALIGL
jgi:mRNA interferase MazF